MIKIFSERYQKNIIECLKKDTAKIIFNSDGENYKNFFGFDTNDYFFKERIIQIIFEFNEPQLTSNFYGRYDNEKREVYVIDLVKKKLIERRAFIKYSNNSFHKDILIRFKWENLFDIIETQQNLLSEKEKKDFTCKINIFFKEYGIPWIIQEEGIITKELIRRNDYFNKLINVENVPDIKIITGIRRSGKSCLLNDFCSCLNPEEINIIRIDLKLEQYKELRIYDKLDNYIKNKFNDKKKNYLIIDEIQECNNFEKIIYSLHEEQKFNIFLSGSNAFIDDKNMASLFGGRYFNIKIYPFSFKEFNKYFNFSNPIDSFDKYVTKGGMAGSYLYNDEANAYSYINEIFKKTIFKDIIKKFNIEEKNEKLLKKITDYLMDNIGNKTSIKKIADCLKISSEITNLYIDYLCRSFLFYPFKSYDIKGKKYLEINEERKKYYLADVSFRFANIGTKDEDRGRIYENLVAIELLRRGYEVYIGILEEKEVDFVAIKNGYKNYFQVSDNISDPKTREREFKPLLSIKDAYPKTLIARTKNPKWQHEGIEVIDIGEWLNNNYMDK